MNNEQMDALFRKVFGDGEVGDDRMLSASDGAVIAQEEIILSNLRSELKALGEVPECQMSSARLRDAILSRGALPESAGFSWKWWKFAVPVAATATLAVFLMQMPSGEKLSNPGSQPIVSAEEVDSMPELDRGADPSAIVMDVQSALESPAPTVVEANSEVPNVAVSQPAKPSSSPANSRKSPRIVASHTPEVVSPGLGGASSADMSSAAMASVRPKSSSVVSSLAGSAIEQFGNRSDDSSMAKAAPAESDPKVVIVTAGTDPTTRASSATEVDKKNVVFGG